MSFTRIVMFNVTPAGYNMSSKNGIVKFGRPDILSATIRCANFAAIKHKDQRRNDYVKTPYINHPIGVAFILTEEGGVTDFEVIQAALLHDTVEDTDTTLSEIEQEFGMRVRDIVAEVTDDKTLPKMERKRLQIEHAAGSSRAAKLVKLADKLYNLRDMRRERPRGWSEGRVGEYFVWARDVVNGLRGTNRPIEDSLDVLFRERGLI